MLTVFLVQHSIVSDKNVHHIVEVAEHILHFILTVSTQRM